jgi:aminopeptidase-like protein
MEQCMESADTIPDTGRASTSEGEFCHDLAKRLFPICRSLTGPGVRQTLEIITELLPGLIVHAVPSGTRAFDWTVPEEWTIRDAYIENESGQRIVDFRRNNLHVVGYSTPVDEWLSRDELDRHLHSLPELPNAIPYVTSYYARRWGFCLTHAQRINLPHGRYRAVVDADLQPGVLNYGELVLPGQLGTEVFVSTYVCHPSMANNELSGPVVATALARWLMAMEHRRYTYRFVFIPETIGSIVYLSRQLDHLKRHVVAGFNVTCIGDERCYSYVPSRAGDTLADRAALHVLRHIDPSFRRYSWLDRGSDERQYCAPGVDLPVATITRSKYLEYPEYHTSLDDLNLVTPVGLQGGFDALRRAIEVIENDCRIRTTVLAEPQLGKRGLYPTLGTKDSGREARAMMNLLSYADGHRSLLEIAEITDEPHHRLVALLRPLVEAGLIQIVRSDCFC